jgi:hypothetical protein
MSPRLTCLFCDAPLRHGQRAAKARFCGEPCRWKYAALGPHQLCRTCARPLEPRRVAQGICASLDCWRQAVSEDRARDRQRVAALVARAGPLRDGAASRMDVEEAETYQLMIIPSYHEGRITELPDSRRSAFRDRLRQLIDAADAEAHASDAVNTAPIVEPELPDARQADVQAVQGRACALCRGNCCRSGRDHAFISVETFRGYLAEHPHSNTDEVLATYLAYIGKETFEGSCVYHQSTGCSLPRDLRSRTCNTWLCTGLMTFQDSVRGSTDPPRAFFVSTSSDDTFRDAAFCSVNESRRIQLPIWTGN